MLWVVGAIIVVFAVCIWACSVGTPPNDFYEGQ